ncbi:hypothetical protein [Paraburkholderia fungorum]|uniref:hypothetical protein n=1 Tax=Paraburkholderia fungorum TaxID=134537 RepID=UPI0038BC680A
MTLLAVDDAQEETTDFRRYMLESFGAETWKQTASELAVTFGYIRQFPPNGYVPAELSDFGGLNFREALSGQNRMIMRCVTTPSTFTSLPIRAGIYERFSRNDYCVFVGESCLTGTDTPRRRATRQIVTPAYS